MAAIATKFALWEVPALHTLKDTRAYILRQKVNNILLQVIHTQCLYA